MSQLPRGNFDGATGRNPLDGPTIWGGISGAQNLVTAHNEIKAVRQYIYTKIADESYGFAAIIYRPGVLELFEEPESFLRK
jgi:hypothetical protein